MYSCRSRSRKRRNNLHSLFIYSSSHKHFLQRLQFPWLVKEHLELIYGRTPEVCLLSVSVLNCCSYWVETVCSVEDTHTAMAELEKFRPFYWSAARCETCGWANRNPGKHRSSFDRLTTSWSLLERKAENYKPKTQIFCFEPTIKRLHWTEYWVQLMVNKFLCEWV